MGIRKMVGGTFAGVGCLVWGGWGLLSFLVNFSIVINGLGWGFIGGVLAFMFFPITIAFAPWYALIAWGNPLPLIVTYGGALVGGFIMMIGGVISGDD